MKVCARLTFPKLTQESEIRLLRFRKTWPVRFLQDDCNMFSGIPQKNRAAATTYFDEHLSHNDYYTQGETQAGHWLGIGAEKLGLAQGELVTRAAFLKLCDNLHPETGQQLTLRRSQCATRPLDPQLHRRGRSSGRGPR